MGIIPSMTDTTWRDRLRAVLDGPPKLDMKAISLRAGLGATFVRDILERGRQPSVDNFVAVCGAIGVSPLALIYGDEVPRIDVPVVGSISNGEDWSASPEAAISPLELTLAGEDLVGIDVIGDRLSPAYRNGDLLLGHRQFGKYLDNIIGLDCIVRTTEGKGHIKILKRGTRPGRYTLKSIRPLIDDIENVAIEWAAPIKWIKRRS